MGETTQLVQDFSYQPVSIAASHPLKSSFVLLISSRNCVWLFLVSLPKTNSLHPKIGRNATGNSSSKPRWFYVLRSPQTLGILAHLVRWWLGCTITSETHRSFRFHETILSFGEPGSLGKQAGHFENATILVGRSTPLISQCWRVMDRHFLWP